MCAAGGGNLDDVRCDGRYREVAYDPHEQIDKICRICRPEEGLAIGLDLVDVNLDHLLLDLTDNGPKDIRHREPKENVNIAREPGTDKMLKTGIYSQPEYQWPYDGKNDEVKDADRVDTERSGFKKGLQASRKARLL